MVHHICTLYYYYNLKCLKFKLVGMPHIQPDLVTITSGFTDCSILLFLALVLLGIALSFMLDVTGMEGKGFASRLCKILV